MYKIATILSISLLVVGCVTTSKQSPDQTPRMDSAKSAANNVMMDYRQDNVGRDYFASYREATGKKVFIFDPKVSAWAVYDASGNRVKTGRASGGMHYCSDVKRACRTVQGHFRVYSKEGASCTSSKFPLGKGGAPMPYCMHFHGGYAIHGSYDVPRHNASHGCIRVLPSAAKWLNQEFMDHGTTVIVKSY